MKRYSLKAQAAEARRQLAMMRRFYPLLAEEGRIPRADIDCDLPLMENVVATLEWLERNERLVRHAAAAAKNELPPIGGEESA